MGADTMNFSSKNRIIPVVTDVVVPGDPDIIRQAKERKAKEPVMQHAALNFQRRIDDVEDVIGQTEALSASRAHAIRAEKSSSTLAKQS